MIRASTYGNGRQRLNYAIKHRLDFTTGGALKGAWESSPVFSGLLPHDEREQLRVAESGNPVGTRIYVIRSYSTPIAWYTRGVWTVPNVTYSVTTSRHQSIVRTEIER